MIYMNIAVSYHIKHALCMYVCMYSTRYTRFYSYAKLQFRYTCIGLGAVEFLYLG